MSISIPGADYTPQLTGYTGQGAFRFWCQKVLPLVYDDSLSYYELLNKVVNYLNNVIADVASVENNIGQLNTSYINLQNFVNETNGNIESEINEFETSVTTTVRELQTFVNDYFDNLDVQQEINHKLDVMASDGSLTALLVPLIANEAPDIITRWMSEHITPTTPVVDSSLSIEGAAADAKVTGDSFKRINGELYGTKQDIVRQNVTSFDLLNNPIENFNSTTSSISEFWGTRYLYRPGYVESVTIYRDKESPNENITVLIADRNYKILWYKIVQNNSQTVHFAVGKSFANDFIVLVRCDGMRYGNAHSEVGGIYWAGTPQEGTTITPTDFGQHSFGFSVDYADSFSTIMKELSEANGADFSLIKTNVASYNTSEYPDYSLTSITSSVSEFWGSDYLFNSGMVKSIRVKRRKNEPYQSITVILVDENYKILFKTVINSTEQVVDVPIGYFAKSKFRIAIRCDGMIYGNTGSNYRSFYWSGNPTVDQTIVPTEYGRFSFGVVVEYGDLIEAIVSQDYGNEYEYMVGTSDFSAYTGNIGGGFWGTLNTYPSGYIERLVFNEGANSITCIVVDSIENKILFRGVSNGNVLTIKRMFNNPVYLYLYGATLKYTVKAGLAGSYSNVKETVFNALDVGSNYTPSWTTGNYIFAVKAIYKNVISGDLVLRRQDNSRLFICGDSITAGYPYIAGEPNGINEDIRWGRQVARRLKFDVTFGASSGNGWVYSTGSANAYTITRDTDFSNYDVAIYAWGTNDYGHSSALGDLSDNPSDILTVCSRIKWCINKIYTDNPNIVLILVLPINRADVGTKANNYGYGEVNSAGYSLNDMCDKIAELCKEHNIAYIDNRLSPFNRYSLLSLTVDGLHPNYKGYKLLGSRLAGEVSKIITPYFEDGYTENV